MGIGKDFFGGLLWFLLGFVNLDRDIRGSYFLRKLVMFNLNIWKE